MSPGHANDRGGRGGWNSRRPSSHDRGRGGFGGRGEGEQRGRSERGGDRPDPNWPAPFDPTRENEAGESAAEFDEEAGGATQQRELRPGAPSADVRSVQLDSDEDVSSGPWIFGRQVRDQLARPLDGSIVEVLDRSGRYLGHGLYNSASDIRVRMLSRGRRSDLEKPRQFLLKRLKSADDLRRKWLRLPEVTDAYRIAHAEGDDLPGLIVDRIGNVLVCEYHSLGFFELRDDIEWALGELYPGLAALYRVPANAARAEGFQPQDDLRDPGEQIVREHGIVYAVRPGGGHKTGFFCDQRDNRRLVAQHAVGRDVLDLCCNQGGFSLQAKKAGARRVRGVDLDEVVLERAQEGARRNQLDVEFVHADAFPFLRHERTRQASDRAHVVVVDPHKLIASRLRMDEGLKKYHDLNALAFECVRGGGLVASFSCSGPLSEAHFIGMLFQSARRANRSVRLIQQLGAAADHPQRPDFARSRYLKGALLYVE